MAYTVKSFIRVAQKEQKRLTKEKEKITEDLNDVTQIIRGARRLRGRALSTQPKRKVKKWTDGWTVSRARVSVDLIRAAEEITKAELKKRLEQWYPKGFSWPSLNRSLKRWIKKMGGIKIEGRGENRVFKTAKKKNLKEW